MASGGRRKRRRVDDVVRVDVNGATAAAIGSQAGVAPAELDALEERLRDAIERLDRERAEGRRPFLELALAPRALQPVKARADGVRGDIDRCVVIGADGSTLGNRVLAGLGGEGVVLLDGADPRRLADVLERTDLRRTLFHVIARAGESVEALAAFAVVRERLLSELGAVDYVQHLLLTTDADVGPLRQITNDEGLHASPYPAGVAGHQSASSPEHLFAAQLAGADVAGYLTGVRAMDERCRAAPAENPAALLAATYYLLATLHGIQISVLLPFGSSLEGWAQWWRHYWAATLGKKLEGESSSVCVGMTPVVSPGTLDHQTQLQVYLDGPADKVLTFLRVEADDAARAIPAAYADVDDIAYVGGRSLHELLTLQHAAVGCALARAGRPGIVVDVPRVSASVLGQLVRLFESAGLLCASLHDVDPQARPAVEGTRRLLYGVLGREGFEAEADEVRRWMGSAGADERWVR